MSQARTRRDQGWQLIKSVWLDGETLEKEISEYDESKDLPGAFERGIHSADEVSDQLRSAADRVHQYASLLAEVEKLEQQQQRLVKDAADIAKNKEQLEGEWQAVWDDSKLQPRSPREMRSWIDQCQEVRRNLREGKKKESEKQPLSEQRKQLCAAVIGELKSVGHEKDFPSAELSPVLVYAEQTLSELKAIEEQRQAVQGETKRNQRDLSDAKEELSEAQQAMSVWTEQWVAALDGFGLPKDASAEEAENTLEALRSCLKMSADIDAYKQRLEDIDQHAQKFETSVSSLVNAIAPELEALAADQAVAKLQAMVREAEKAKSVLEKVVEDFEAATEEIRQASVDQKAVESELTALRELARCESNEDLVQVDTRFRDCRATETALVDLEEALIGIAEGIGFDVLEEQRQAIDPNELPGQIDGLTRQIQDDLEPQIKLLSEKKERPIMSCKDGWQRRGCGHGRRGTSGVGQGAASGGSLLKGSFGQPVVEERN